MSRFPQYQAFNDAWFVKHQSKLLWFLNTPVVRNITRAVFRIHGERSDVGHNDILKIEPTSITWATGNTDEYKTEFRADVKFSKRVYFALSPIWWLMHCWDWAIADRWFPELSFGFNTLTVYPDPTGGTPATFSAFCYYTAGDSSWATMRDATVANSGPNYDGPWLGYITSGSASNTWRELLRMFMTFNTAALTSSALISAATLSLYYISADDGSFASCGINIGAATPASNNVLVVEDYDQVADTLFSSTIRYNAFGAGYNDFAFNASGIANISKTGISRFAAREANHDMANSPPTWASLTNDAVQVRYANYAGTSADPKLVITYTVQLPFARAMIIT